jgi:hypothetical protein
MDGANCGIMRTPHLSKPSAAFAFFAAKKVPLLPTRGVAFASGSLGGLEFSFAFLSLVLTWRLCHLTPIAAKV